MPDQNAERNGDGPRAPVPPCRLTASEASVMIRAGRLSVEQLARSCLERITQRDGEVRGWAFIDPDLILDRARELDKTSDKGPLHGIPIGIKDVIDTDDMPTRHNSPSYYHHHPALDAACVMILRAAGALIFGKTETVEFAAAGRQPLTRNPKNLDHTPGGSSSGSAATVADFQVPLSLGTQTGGSTIRAASFCGIYAMKPTWNVVSREGVKVQSLTLDTVGWYARSVNDLALLCDVYAIHDDDPAKPFELSRARIAVCETPVWEHADRSTHNALEAGSEALRAAGVETVPLILPPPFEELSEAQVIIQSSEGRAAFLSEYRVNYSGLHPILRERVENRENITRAALRRAYDVAAQCRMIFEEICTDFDAILTPSATGEAPAGFQSTGWDIFNRIWSLLHVPCINLPGFRGVNDLPVGLTLTGPRFSDRHLLTVANDVSRCFAARQASVARSVSTCDT
jgi:Asp-tRNA(Asn)/Glu-tRNA(Gln) amidotransferase A subunit family amidase